jgi:hypothetical protein
MRDKERARVFEGSGERRAVLATPPGADKIDAANTETYIPT